LIFFVFRIPFISISLMSTVFIITSFHFLTLGLMCYCFYFWEVLCGRKAGREKGDNERQ
jgi:hypothetical protein